MCPCRDWFAGSVAACCHRGRAVASDREYAVQLLDAVEQEAEAFLGGALTGSGVEWLT